MISRSFYEQENFSVSPATSGVAARLFNGSIFHPWQSSASQDAQHPLHVGPSFPAPSIPPKPLPVKILFCLAFVILKSTRDGLLALEHLEKAPSGGLEFIPSHCVMVFTELCSSSLHRPEIVKRQLTRSHACSFSIELQHR